MHHGFTDSHMSSVSRRLTAYVEGSHMEEEVGRNLHVTYAFRVALNAQVVPSPKLADHAVRCTVGVSSAT
jgi:hypothetical protein